MKKFLGWLVDNYLYDYIVRREDFDQVQFNWQQSRGFIRHQQEEMGQLLESLYTRKHKTFAEDSQRLVCLESSYERVDIRHQVFRWEVSIPDRTIAISYDPKKVVGLERQKAVHELSKNITRYLTEQFFGKV